MTGANRAVRWPITAAEQRIIAAAVTAWMDDASASNGDFRGGDRPRRKEEVMNTRKVRVFSEEEMAAFATFCSTANVVPLRGYAAKEAEVRDELLDLFIETRIRHKESAGIWIEQPVTS